MGFSAITSKPDGNTLKIAMIGVGTMRSAYAELLAEAGN
jgi:hypothetical protein